VAGQGLLFFCGALNLTASLASVFPRWLIVSFALRVWNLASSRLPAGLSLSRTSLS
jgi:hypothetical protein